MSTDPHSTSERRSFRHNGAEVVIGYGSLSQVLEDLGEAVGPRPLIIIGLSASSNAQFTAAIQPLLDLGNGEPHIKVGSAKDPRVVADAVTAFGDVRATGIIAVGGGDALDLGKQVSYYARNRERLDVALATNKDVVTPSASATPAPLAVVPAELAGSGLSSWASMSIDVGSTRRVKTLPVRSSLVMAVYDSHVFGAVPPAVLRQSYFNGLNKGIETLYSRSSHPLSDATSSMGVSQLLRGSRDLADDSGRLGYVSTSLIEGIVLVQLHRRLSLIHALGHAISRAGGPPQGLVHAAISPVVLAWLLPRLRYRERTRIALAVVGHSGASVDEVVDIIDGVRRDLGLPSCLREVGVHAIHEGLVESVLADRMMRSTPLGVELGRQQIRELLRAAI